jgi:hypothetical protein
VSAGGVRDRDAAVGLCARCRFGHAQPTARGAVFWRCRRAESDARFPRYPPLPVRECAGFDPARTDGIEGAGAPR